MGLNKSSKLLIGLLLGVVLAWVAVCGQAEDLAGVQSPPSSVGIDSPALPAVLTGDDLLRQAREHLIENNFEQARTVLADSLDLPEEEAERLGGWLNDYQEFVAQRRSSREETAKKHVKEAQEHLKEKKFEEALASTYLAVMASPEPDSLRSEDWLDELTQLCVGLARKFSDEGEYGKSAVILSEIARIYDDDPTWKELSKDAGLHAGMLGAYDGESDWQLRLEDAKTSDFENAVDVVGNNFVKAVNHRNMLLGALKGYRHFLTTKGLAKDLSSLEDKYAVISLVDYLDDKIETIKNQPHVTAGELVRTYYYIIQKNRQGLSLPEPILVDLFINQACQAIDDYTEMIWPEQGRWFIRQTTGSFSGIGVQIRSNEAKQLEVVTPLTGTPAFRAGLQAGDLITAVDGKNTEGISVDEAVRRITGKRGTKVILTIRRPGRAEPKDVPIVRDTIKIKSVLGYTRRSDHEWNYIVDEEHGIAYVRISNFMQNTVGELDEALKTCRAQGAKALIIDLRFDPGGTLKSAEEVSDRFLEAGQLVVRTRGLSAKKYSFRARRPESCPGWPIVVLTTDKSASASEIVAGALQDHNRAIVVGERTFGKGLVQRPFRLRGWSDSEVVIKVTTAYWYLPGGRNVQRSDDSVTWGVEPDFAVKLTPEEFRSLRTRWVNADIIRNSNHDSEDDPEQEAAVEPGKDETDAELIVEPVEDEAEDEGDLDLGEAEPAEGGETVSESEEPEEEKPDVPDPQLETALLLARLELMVRER